MSRRWLQLLRDRQNLELVISVTAVLLSCWSVVFSVYSFRKQFQLDMRPFVGIAKVDAVDSANATRVTAVIRNVGKLPSDDTKLRVTWTIESIETGRAAQQLTREEALDLVFPGAEFSYTVPFESFLFEKYLKAPGYRVNILYEIDYSAKSIDGRWKTAQKFSYRVGARPMLQSSSGT